MSSVVHFTWSQPWSAPHSSNSSGPLGRALTRGGIACFGLAASILFYPLTLRAQTVINPDEPVLADAATVAMAGSAGGHWSNEVLKLDKIGVTARSEDLAELADRSLASVPGGVSVVRPDVLERGRVANVADALRLQPGVLAQSANGGEATRLSIRGSGLTRAPFLFGWGTQVLLDGLPLYSTSGVPYETIEPLVVSNIQVLRGANGFDYGPLSLGGVINYATRTGYDAEPFQARFEAGSFGYLRAQVSSGQVRGPLDYYVSATRFEQDGFRDRTAGYSSRLVFNAGYKLNSRLTTRFNFRYARQIQQDAGSLTWAQLQANPRQSQFADIRIRENPRTYLLSNTSTYVIDDESFLEFGLQYHNYPINGVGGPAPNRFPFEDLAGYLRYSRNDRVWGGKASKTLVALYGYDQIYTRFDSYNAAGGLTGRRPSDLGEWTLVASNELQLTPALALSTGLAGIYQTRETSISYSSLALIGPNVVSHQYRNLAPRAGLRYDLRPQVSLFANVSRSIDTPSSNSFVRTNALLIPLTTIDLKAQKATTVEVGSRGESGRFKWNVSLYHSYIDDELLTVQIAPGSPPVTVTSNATPTHHQGIEAGLDTTLWENKSPDAKSRHRVGLRQTYTFNDFYYDNDPIYHTNKLPAVPRHVYQAELDYEHASGLYGGLTVDAVLGKYAVDFANTFFAKPYTVWGARLGYAAPGRGWEVFVEGRNLGDRKYAPVVAPTFNANGNDVAVFAPGQGRSVSVGVSLRL